ncbi:alpha/beta-type small acid-soluble spore protein [Sporosarcina ureilytica]|uniref:Alpha/beta hydrolase n=1 Tax=Sporosarcina ureilytica TaxID=298596 RepID=A0A1D8JEG0_9BACL|nr:alpha/beta-type small acid-soluble spore protein [Sporosarcina ureilytica]AOV07086.1 alpha/beta hydrolase [Sporosarcina ureilytica]
MAKNNKILVPEAREGLNKLKADVMKKQGYRVPKDNPDNVKFEIADELGIPLSKGNNGQITAENAGKIGGSIGGSMVKEMVRMAQQQMLNNQSKE